MFSTFHIALHERAVLLQHGLPQRFLVPGRHRVFGFGFEVLRFDVRELVAAVEPALRAVVPAEALAEVTVEDHERAVLLQDGRPRVLLRPGIHRYWTVDPHVELRVYALDEPVPSLTDALRAVLDRQELVEVTIGEHERGLLYRKGRLERLLEPGQYAFWTTTGAPVSVRRVDLRRKQLAIPAQELLTRDKVTLRLSLTVDWAPADPKAFSHLIANAEGALYGVTQLAVREYVAGVTLDALLEGRDAMQRFLEARVRAEAETFGVRVAAVGVKDVILPGEMKVLLNRVIEAEKQAAANVILRREEAAATRLQANAAKVMAEHPVLLRMKELEAYTDIAGRIGELKLQLGADALEELLPKLRE